jgi:DNA-binding IclR family transcriptional regulator
MLNTLAKAGQVLDLFGECEEWGVTDLSVRLGLSKSNAHDLLSSLAAINLLQRTKGSRYRLGWRLISMAGRVADAALLRRHAPEYLQALARAGGETTHLAVWEGQHIFFVAQAVAPHGGMDRPEARPGALLPGHATSSGKILLGQVPWEEALAKVTADGFDALTPATIVGPVRLRREFERVAETGFAVSLEETVVGVSTVAVPVRGPNGEVIAALGASMEADRLPAFLATGVRTMTATAARLAASLRAPDSRELAEMASTAS